MSINISDQISDVLDEYVDEVKKATNDSINSVAREAVNTLRSSSPSKTGDYARGWAKKKAGDKNGIADVIIHNRTDYQLTHLLEFGHVVRNKKGTYGRAPARPHIKPVEEWAMNELPEEIKRRLE